MTKLEDIKTSITKLSDVEVARLRQWLAELDAQRFDERLDRDAAAGKLDELARKARANHAAGRRRDL